MAAVDVDVREVTKAAKARAGALGGSRWKRGEDGGGGGVHVHEQVVCSIKAHQNGTLEIAPGTYCTKAYVHGCLLGDHKPVVVGSLVWLSLTYPPPQRMCVADGRDAPSAAASVIDREPDNLDRRYGPIVPTRYLFLPFCFFIGGGGGSLAVL